MLHRKSHIENHLQSAQKRLTARIELLTTNGVNADRIIKDNQIKHLKAQMREAKSEMAAISAMEALMVEKAESRKRKEAAAKQEALQGKSKTRERNAAPAKKRNKRRLEVDGDEH